MIEAAPDAIIITDAEGTITLLNEQAVAMFDYTQEELLGQKVEVLLPARLPHVMSPTAKATPARRNPGPWAWG
ncbi:PAS domain-containing protein [Halopseudomonas pachastrellae]|nr:PAS domain-containing protein [Halopseudomonas pachastrellae]